MKNIIFLLFTTINIYAQSKLETPTKKEIIVGSFISGEKIIGEKITFTERINDFYVSDDNTLLINFRGLNKYNKPSRTKGLTVFYDLISDDIKWNRKSNTSIKYKEIDGIIVKSTSSGSNYRINKNTGDKDWKIATDLNYVDTLNNVFFGYRSNKGGNSANKDLRAHNLKDGNLIWKRKIDRTYGWNIYPINDSIILIKANGIHKINLRTGYGWDYKLEVGANKVNGNALFNVLGIASGLLTGNLFLMGDTTSRMYGFDSNLIRDSLSVYTASKDLLSKVDINTGNLLWKVDFPKKSIGKSILIDRDTSLLMINYGYAYYNRSKISYGEPFIASFDKSTGKQVFKTSLTLKDKDYIKSILVLEDNVNLLFKNKIESYSMDEGLKNLKSKFKLKGTYNLFNKGYFIRDKDDNSLFNPLNINNIYVSGGEKIIELNQNFEVLNSYSYDELYALDYEFEKVRIIKNDTDQFIFINLKNKKIANLSSSSLYFTKKYILDFDGHNLIKINLKQILNK